VGNGSLFLWWAGSSFSWGAPLPGHEFLLLITVGAAALALVSLLLIVFRRTREAGLALLLGSVIYAVTTPLALHAGGKIRMWGFGRFIERSEPLIAAIREYDAVYGHPPETLDALVPEFLPEVPSTGVGSSPVYEYTSLVAEEDFTKGDNRWMLHLPVGLGVLNWDLLIFLPNGDYPEHGWGGWLEPVSDWAYVHE
jgi:hypothetical protein